MKWFRKNVHLLYSHTHFQKQAAVCSGPSLNSNIELLQEVKKLNDIINAKLNIIIT